MKDAVPIKLDETNITLQFSTVFHKDKIMEHDHRVELEETIKELFGQAVKILTVVKSIEIKPVVEDSSHAGGGQSGSAVDDALEIFGGQVMD